ncbi:hypothetical protein J7E88_33005 [Streptomyces sp. ISL-10]|uniref:DUF6197 family protein n=1 Tax=Streptomyces sp. ISL-10 TaxID=2819172 RepID=UPI001BE7D2E4|nr:hypothetical protein [Streptomyces sp. ISL-10]MBT2369958.1 hypothetical protein [Streptomyces sp. ISL-10]
MPQTHPSPATDHSAQTTEVLASPAELSLEERLTFINAAMTVRLDEAKVAYEVNTAHISTEPVDLGDVVTVPLTPALKPMPDHCSTPVATLLQRAHHRLLTGGWCTGALVDEQGARCLYGVIRAEATGNSGLEADAVSVLLDAIRRAFGSDVTSVPSFNDGWSNSRVPLRMLDEAAFLADARGL